MNKDAKMFVFLVAIGFTSAMILSLIPWGLVASCLQNGMVPAFSSKEPGCVEVSTPQAFGFNYVPNLSSNVAYDND